MTLVSLQPTGSLTSTGGGLTGASTSFNLAQAGQLTGAAPAGDQRGSGAPPLDANARSRLSNLLGVQPTPEQLSYEIVNAPNRPETGGTIQQGGQILAFANAPAVNTQAREFGLDARRLGQAVIEQEVAQKVMQTDPNLARTSRQDQEAVGEAAMLASYPASAIRTLERSAQVRTPSDDYAGIADLTETALGEAIRLSPREAGAAPITGEQALEKFNSFVEANGGRFSNYQDLFKAFASEELGMKDPAQFQGVFERTMGRTFQDAATRITREANGA